MYVVVFLFLIAAALCFLFDWWKDPTHPINTTLGFFFVAVALAAWIWWASDSLHHILSGG